MGSRVRDGLGAEALPGPCSPALLHLQPGQRETSFQPEQEHGKVFRGHRCGDQAGTGVGGRLLPWGTNAGLVLLLPRPQPEHPGSQLMHLSLGTR